jgi:single-strand DNA-binding protein
VASFNNVVLVGNVTRDIELKYIQNGNAVATISLAVSEKYKTKSGEAREDVCFIDCTCWGRTAEVASQYLSKGSPVLIQGRLKHDRWEKDGAKHSRHTVTVSTLQLLGSKNDGQQQQGSHQGGQRANQQAPPQQQSAPQQQEAFNAGPVDDNDIPF